MNTPLHHCHADGCKVVVPPEKLMCKRHWTMVPPNLQRRIWATYRVGQCDDKNPSTEWLNAADLAIAHVRFLEKRVCS